MPDFIQTLSAPNFRQVYSGLPGPALSVTIAIEDEGVPKGTAITINFAGSGVSANVVGTEATVTIPGGIGSVSWGDILGTVTDQGDLVSYISAQIASAVTGLLDLKGGQDCSANPNYPAASKGDAYPVTVAGKIGGASGVSVDVGDVIVAAADNAGGTQASVGSSWFVLEHNLSGVLLASNNLSDLTNVGTARTNLGLLRLIAFFFTTTPTASEVLGIYIAADAFTLPANLSGSQGKKISGGANPAATFAIDVQQNGASIGTISISTGGVVTLTTTSGSAKSIAAGDIIHFIGPSTPDTTIASWGFNIKGTL